MNITLASNGPIIMVDDSEADQLIAKRCYQKSVLQNPFMTFFKGEEFLAYMDSVLKKEALMPALVFLDLNMPVMDGFEILGAIRHHQEFSHLPVLVILTNSDNPKDADRSLAMGANGYHIKPLHVSEFIAFFNSLRQ